jgi:hypothetical protein
MGRASRRKKAKKQGFQKTFIISESTLTKVVQALQQNADSQEALPKTKQISARVLVAGVLKPTLPSARQFIGQSGSV